MLSYKDFMQEYGTCVKTINELRSRIYRSYPINSYFSVLVYLSVEQHEIKTELLVKQGDHTTPYSGKMSELPTSVLVEYLNVVNCINDWVIGAYDDLDESLLRFRQASLDSSE